MVKERLAGITVPTQGEYQRVWNGNTEHTGRTEDKIELIRYTQSRQRAEFEFRSFRFKVTQSHQDRQK